MALDDVHSCLLQLVGSWLPLAGGWLFMPSVGVEPCLSIGTGCSGHGAAAMQHGVAQRQTRLAGSIWKHIAGDQFIIGYKTASALAALWDSASCTGLTATASGSHQ